MPRTFVWHPMRGPKVTPKDAPAEGGQLRIRQVRSEIGHSWRMRQTLRALGLRHHQQEVVQQDTPALRGALKKVRHLVEVSPVKE
jgi:large subunit ribosomal protein L30